MDKKIERWDDCLQFDVDVYDRALLILYNGGCEEREKIDDALEKRYAEWVESKDDSVRCTCCEEYLLRGLDELGIDYKAVYIGGENDD